jgi:hypothetical protein
MQPTNPPNVEREIDAIAQAVKAQMSSKGPLEPPRFVVTTAPGNNAPLQLQAEAPAQADSTPAAPTPPRFDIPATPPPTYVVPKATHAPQAYKPPTRYTCCDPAPQLSTEHIVVIVGVGAVLALGYFLYTKWANTAPLPLPDVAPP